MDKLPSYLSALPCGRTLPLLFTAFVSFRKDNANISFYFKQNRTSSWIQGEKREKEKESAWERVIEIYNSLKTDAGKTSNSNTAVAPLLQPRHTAQCLTGNSFSKRKTTNVVSFTAEDPFSVPFLWCQMFYHVTGRCLGQASLKSLKFLKISSVKCALISPAHTDEYYFHVEMNYKWDL